MKLISDKVCFGSTAQFKITPFYESYYGFKTEYVAQAEAATDILFYQINGGKNTSIIPFTFYRSAWSGNLIQHIILLTVILSSFLILWETVHLKARTLELAIQS